MRLYSTLAPRGTTALLVIVAMSLAGCMAVQDDPSSAPTDDFPILYVWKFVPQGIVDCFNDEIRWEATFELGNKGLADVVNIATTVELEWKDNSKTVSGSSIQRLSPGNDYRFSISERLGVDCDSPLKYERVGVHFSAKGTTEHGDYCCTVAELITSNSVIW